ncbi:helix-turn-helix domain-containing protein [Actinomadura monticuli]|uniref:Helix-turn-helix domain-containing protein n=1 Tax=Actinomadura monticuli TaxID=3097367 RepID=A0ABV4QFF2_9ACTN
MPTLVETSDHPAPDQAGRRRSLITPASGPCHVRPRRPAGSGTRPSGRALRPVDDPSDARVGGAETLRAIQEWIEARLHDPALCPAAIAAAHHISVRQLYRVFRPAGTTVARYVRARRLENCRRELADPFLGAQRIGAIAGRWGLPDAAAFSRAFRAAYGQTPTAYRARAAGLGRPA